MTIKEAKKKAIKRQRREELGYKFRCILATLIMILLVSGTCVGGVAVVIASVNYTFEDITNSIVSNENETKNVEKKEEKEIIETVASIDTVSDKTNEVISETKETAVEINEEIHQVHYEKMSKEEIVSEGLSQDENVAQRMTIDHNTMSILIRVVEAEVTGSSFRYKGNDVSYDELLKSKIRVAQVFMNRVEDQHGFKNIDSLYEALTYPGATSTFDDGRYYKVEITDITREAVRLALRADTPDYTDGALFFNTGTSCKYGSYLFTDAVGHSFYK